METLIAIVLKFPADELLAINWGSWRLWWAIYDQPKVRKMYQKEQRTAVKMCINIAKENEIEAKIGPDWDWDLDWKVVPPKVVQNVRELAPKPDDGIDFNDIFVTLPFGDDDLVSVFV